MIKTSQKLKEVMSEPWSLRALDSVGLHIMVYALLVSNKWFPYSKRCSVDPKHQIKKSNIKWGGVDLGTILAFSRLCNY